MRSLIRLTVRRAETTRRVYTSDLCTSSHDRHRRSTKLYRARRAVEGDFWKHELFHLFQQRRQKLNIEKKDELHPREDRQVRDKGYCAGKTRKSHGLKAEFESRPSPPPLGETIFVRPFLSMSACIFTLTLA